MKHVGAIVQPNHQKIRDKVVYPHKDDNHDDSDLNGNVDVGQTARWQLKGTKSVREDIPNVQ